MFESLRDYPAAFRCSGVYERNPERIVVLAQRISPTRDLYLKKRLSGSSLPVVYWTLGEECPVSLAGAFLIVVRYVDSGSIAKIERSEKELSGVAWLIDDDVAAAIGDRDLPLHYRIFMGHFWLRFSRRLARVTSEIWAASDVLKERLAPCGPTHRIDPFPEEFALPREREGEDSGQIRVFYHGQKTHRPERRWLYQIVTPIHARYPQVCFEIVGDNAVRSRYRKLERVSVRSADSWPDYLERSRTVRFDIGLAPLMPTPFNRARSWVKYLDIARFGAIGIYADGLPYDCVVRDGENGLLRAAHDPKAWIEALGTLVEDGALRRRLALGVDWPAEIATPPRLLSLRRQG